MSTQVATKTNYVERVLKMSAKASMNEATKAMESVKENSSKLAVVVNHIITSEYMSRDELATELGFSKASLTKLQKAGEFYTIHPDLIGVEYSKAYLLGKAEKNGIEIDDSVLEMSQAKLQELSKKVLNAEYGATNSYVDTDSVSETEEFEDNEYSVDNLVTEFDVFRLADKIEEFISEYGVGKVVDMNTDENRVIFYKSERIVGILSERFFKLLSRDDYMAFQHYLCDLVVIATKEYADILNDKECE